MRTVSAFDLFLPDGNRNDDFRHLQILDARSGGDFYRGHVPGAQSTPFHELNKHLPRNRYTPLIIYGSNQKETHRYGLYLTSMGYYEVSLLAGGRESYCRTGLPIEHSLIRDPQFIRNMLIIVFAGGWGILSWLFPQYHFLILGIFLTTSLCLMIPNPLSNYIFSLFIAPSSLPPTNLSYLTKTGKITRYTFTYTGTEYRSHLCVINDILILFDPRGSRDIRQSALSQYSFSSIILIYTYTPGDSMILSIPHDTYQTKWRGPQSWISSEKRQVQTDTLIHLGDYQLIQTHHTRYYCSYTLMYQGSIISNYVGPLFYQPSRGYRMQPQDIIIIQGYINSLITMNVRKIIGSPGIGGSDVFSYRDLLYDSASNWKSISFPSLQPLTQREQWRIKTNQQGGYTPSMPHISYDRTLLTQYWILDWRSSKDYRSIPLLGTWYFSPAYHASGDILLPPPSSPQGVLTVMTTKNRDDAKTLFFIKGWTILFHTVLSLTKPLTKQADAQCDYIISAKGSDEMGYCSKEDFVEKYQDGHMITLGLIDHDDWSWISSRLRLMGKKNNCTPVWLYHE
ncbi:MAG: rhodanese-like domain-containing protein [Candidatus Absconditabacterales bacterium]|nr:rhodanese-like domain-containing protein [Candidatus Absconditabacterales bacterium]